MKAFESSTISDQAPIDQREPLARRIARARCTMALLLPLSVLACGGDDEPKGMGSDADDARGEEVADDDDDDDDDDDENGEAKGEPDAGRGGANSTMRDGGLDASGGSTSSGDGGGKSEPDTNGDASAGGDTGGEGCTREKLKATIDAYFAALSAHDPSGLQVAANVKFTENAEQLALGEGLLWQGAGELKFSRNLLDVEMCGSFTEAVIDNDGADTIIAVRMKLEGQQISEVETIVVDPERGWFPNPDAVIASKSDDWETLVPQDQRATRAELQKIVDDYFALFSGGSLEAFPFSMECQRAENGFSPGDCDYGIPTLPEMKPRTYVIDVEAGSSAGFVLFGGGARGMVDFHFFKVRDGEVHSVRAVVGPATGKSGWE